MRIDERDPAGEALVRIAAHTDDHGLIFGNAREQRLWNIHQRPDNGMISDPEQHIAWHHAHAFDDVAFEDDAVTRRLQQL